MTLNPKLALKSVASIKTFGAVYKVDTNHAWLLPIDENNRRCKAAGYSGLKDYLIKKGLKLTKWRDTGLIKELVKPNGDLMTFDREFPFSKVDNIKPDSKVNELLRTNSCSIKKEETVLSPKRIRSLSPTLRHTAGHVQLVAQQTDNKIKTSQTSINVYYKMRRSKTLTLLKYDKENNALPQERNHNAPNTRNAYPLISGKSLTYLPKESLSKNSTVSKSDSVQSSSIVKPNAIRESVSYRKFDRKINSPATKTFQKPEIHVSRKNSTNVRNPRENLPRPSNNKRSETQYSSLKVNITNKFVDTPPVGNLECNTTTSTTSTALSMFSARSSIHSFNDEKESVIQIDITASGTESHSKVSPENAGTRLFCTYVAEGRANKNEEIQCNSFNKICNDQTNEKQEENTKKTCTKSEPKMVYLRTSEPAVEVLQYSEQVPNSKTRSVKASPEGQLCSQSEKVPHESTRNKDKQNKNQKDCFESMVSTKESCFEDGGNYLAKPCESSKGELGAVKIIYPMSKGIEQKLEISNATPKHLSSETTAVTLDSSQQNHTSLIDMRCTLNDVKYHLENMRRSLESCSESSQKEAHTQHIASILHADNDTTTRLTVLENSDGDTNHSWSDCKQKQPDDEFEATNSNSVIPKVKDRRFSCFNETFQPVILWDMNNRRTAKKANSIHGVLRLKTNLPKQLFLKIEASNVCSPIIRKLLESPLLTRGICNGLSAAITPTLCYHSQQPKDTKIMLLQDQREINRTVGQCYRKRISQKVISYKDAETQTQKNFDEIDDGECKIVRYDSPKRQNMEDTLTKIHAEVYVTDVECECQIPDGDMREDSPEIQNFQVDIYDKDEDSDDCSVYEDALELF